ncbi:MAG: CoA transferase [Dehalococcoidia bacterium]|jgi:crotonobetainyl-CoA:carnitine CoA-transferase CaiB-like acyl-CoA transferase|nr:CoA transferase [Dehalococcoidia bacterium]
MAAVAGPLAGVRILDLSDERGIFAGKLLADLGADVVRVEPPGGDPLRRRGPFIERDAGDDGGTEDAKDAGHAEPVSLWHAFYASNRRPVTIDAASEAGREQLRGLCLEADAVLDCGTLAAAGLSIEELVSAKPDLVAVDVSSFGPDGPWRDLRAPDLVASALGGFAATTGDADTQPLKAFGDMTRVTAGLYAAIAILAGLRHARERGEGQRIDVPVHTAVASCLEHVLMFFWHQEGRVLKRQGSLHWSGAYEVMPVPGGHIMVTITPSLERNLVWLVEDGAHQDLFDEQYQQPENLALLIPRIMQVFREWVATKELPSFFFDAQERHYPYGWVLTPDEVAGNPHLAERDWWSRYPAGQEADPEAALGPGTPYQFSDTPWVPPGPAAETVTGTVDGSGRTVEAMFDEIGWGP